MNEFNSPEEWIVWVFRKEMAANPHHLVPLIDTYIYSIVGSWHSVEYFHNRHANSRLEELSEFCDVLAAE